MVLLKGLQFKPDAEVNYWINGHFSVLPGEDVHAETIHFTGESDRTHFLKNFWYDEKLDEGVPKTAEIKKGGDNLGNHEDLGNTKCAIKKLANLIMLFS